MDPRSGSSSAFSCGAEVEGLQGCRCSSSLCCPVCLRVSSGEETWTSGRAQETDGCQSLPSDVDLLRRLGKALEQAPTHKEESSTFKLGLKAVNAWTC